MGALLDLFRCAARPASDSIGMSATASMQLRSTAAIHPTPTAAVVIVAAVALLRPTVSVAGAGDTYLVSATERVVATEGMSRDGRFVMFRSVYPDRALLVHDRESGRTVRANLSSTGVLVDAVDAALSGDGRYVVFMSADPDVTPGDRNGDYDVFLRDLQAGTTEMVSVSSTGEQYDHAYWPDVSDDGRFVAFNSPGGIYVRDRLTRQTSVRAMRDPGYLVISGNGRYLVYTNWDRVVFYDRSTGSSELVSVNLAGGPEDGDALGVSNDGRFVLFASGAANLVPDDSNGSRDAFVRDRSLRVTERVSLTDDERQFPYESAQSARISADGRFVVFTAATRPIIVDDAIYGYVHQVFLRDRAKATTRLASVNSAGVEANHDTSFVGETFVSDDGRFVAFASDATNLSPDDTDAYRDAYVHEFAVAPLGAFVLSPRSLNFGGVATGATSPARIVQVTNPTAASLAIKWVGLAGTDASQFARTRRCPATLAPGATCTVEVVFAPTAPGSKSARLVVSTGNTGGRSSAALTGTGL